MAQTYNKNRPRDVVITFPNAQMAQEWMHWHDGAGEQFYFEHCGDANVDGADSFTYNYTTNMIRGTKIVYKEGKISNE